MTDRIKGVSCVLLLFGLFFSACNKAAPPQSSAWGIGDGRRAKIFQSPAYINLIDASGEKTIKITSRSELKEMSDAFSWEFIDKNENAVFNTENLQIVAIIEYPVGAEKTDYTVRVYLLANDEVLYYSSMTSAYKAKNSDYSHVVLRLMKKRG